VAVLADDPLGARRERPDDLEPYSTDFERLTADPNHHQTVVVAHGTGIALSSWLSDAHLGSCCFT
jgi:hypothetical protein